MKVDILCSSADHPVNVYLENWITRHGQSIDAALLRHSSDLRGGDVLFLVSCVEIVGESIRQRYRHVLVLHASDLPKGRGWSPHVWQILEGATTITVSLLEAEDAVDSGLIWAKQTFSVPPHYLFAEISAALFETEVALMDDALRLISAGVQPVSQPDCGATYYRRRVPADSQVDPQTALADLFDVIRVSDPKRYPAFFELHGFYYAIELRKVGVREPDSD